MRLPLPGPVHAQMRYHCVRVFLGEISTCTGGLQCYAALPMWVGICQSIECFLGSLTEPGYPSSPGRALEFPPLAPLACVSWGSEQELKKAGALEN